MMVASCKSIIRRNIKKILTAALLLCCVLSVLILNTELLNIHFHNVSFYKEEGPELQFIDDTFNPPAKSIFFHETSYRGGLNSRQACAIETAARANKYWNVYVIFLEPVKSFNTTNLRALKQFDRVKFARINILEYGRNTPVESLISNGALNRSKWRIPHTSDALRFISMYKWGGIYLDTMVVKRLDVLKNNWSARESELTVSTGAMAFSRDRVGRFFATATISEFAKDFRGDLWSHNSNGVITRVLKKECATSVIASMSSKVCKGFEVYGPDLFYPIKWQDAAQYFKPGNISHQPYVFHVWNQKTKNMKLVNNSLYAKLARRYCPSVNEAYGSHFGN